MDVVGRQKIKTVVLLLVFQIFIYSRKVTADVTDDDLLKKFNYFKQTYDKVYKNSDDEELAMKNVAHNINKINQLNEKTLDKDVVYAINKFADINTDELQERYALTLKPYLNLRNHQESEFLRNKVHDKVNTKDFYDLEDSEDLYEEFKKKFNKTYYKKKQENIHYYRFVKTLVEINKSRFNGNPSVKLDENADIVKEPNEFFY